MKYRIKEVCRLDGLNEVIIQCKSRWRWRDIWRRAYTDDEADYALFCAEELIEHLEAEI